MRHTIVQFQCLKRRSIHQRETLKIDYQCTNGKQNSQVGKKDLMNTLPALGSVNKDRLIVLREKCQTEPLLLRDRERFSDMY